VSHTVERRQRERGHDREQEEARQHESKKNSYQIQEASVTPHLVLLPPPPPPPPSTGNTCLPLSPTSPPSLPRAATIYAHAYPPQHMHLAGNIGKIVDHCTILLDRMIAEFTLAVRVRARGRRCWCVYAVYTCMWSVCTCARVCARPSRRVRNSGGRRESGMI
jgi:hypothetical protein